MATDLQEQPDVERQGVDHEHLLELARELDRFSRRFERFCVVQLEQLDNAARQFERDKAQWERQRARDLRQIQENRRALQEAWFEIRDGASAANIEMPELQAENEAQDQLCMKAAGDPLRLLLRPANGSEMLLGQLLLMLTRLNRAHGGMGCRFELSECYERSNGARIVDLHIFPANPLVAMTEGEVSDEVFRWHRFKSTLSLLPLGRGLDQLLESADPLPRDHELPRTFLSAARRAQDGDIRTASSVKRGSKSVQDYSDQLIELIERHSEDGLAIQAVELSSDATVSPE